MTDLPECDWKHLRMVAQAALDRFCTRVLDESRAIIADDAASAHDRYLQLFRLIEKRDRGMAAAFNDMRRSTAFERLAAMIQLGVITDEDLSGFTPNTREIVRFLMEPPRPPGRRSRAR